MARLGMDVDQVAAAGKALKERAAEIDTLVSKLDGIVRSIHGVWEGPDSDQFVNDWWPEHKKTLVAASSHVAGLGQSALNNASEQRDASGNSGSGGGGGSGIPPGVGTSTPFQQDPSVQQLATNKSAVDEWALGANGRGIDVDHAYGNQCVDVINDYAEKRFPGVSHGVSLGGGNAYQIFDNTNSPYFDKIPANGTPQPGDIVCIGQFPINGVPGNGHVAVVQSVENGVVHVLEQNGLNPTGVTQPGTVKAYELPYVQGYLRPKA
ncbi:MAG: 28, gp28 [Rhodoglobus sp.]|nr:28, gp28 [Rhodoglobus sp.]